MLNSMIRLVILTKTELRFTDDVFATHKAVDTGVKNFFKNFSEYR